jgi:hypothetical protein
VVTLFLADSPGKNLFDQLYFREDDRGANTWLVVPNDKGVFHRSSVQDDIVCVHPVQVFLDLKGHPERAKEAASMVRQEKLNDMRILPKGFTDLVLRRMRTRMAIRHYNDGGFALPLV